jgi:hypothetical protein
MIRNLGSVQEDHEPSLNSVYHIALDGFKVTQGTSVEECHPALFDIPIRMPKDHV